MFEPSKTLYSLILEFLTGKPLANAKEIQSAVGDIIGGRPSHQAVYKSLHKLLLEGSVIQVKGLYGLSAQFIKKIQDYSLQLSPEVKKNGNTFRLLHDVEQKGKLKIECSSAVEMRNNTIELLINVLQTQPTSTEIYWHTRHSNACYVGMTPNYQKIYENGTRVKRIIYGDTESDHFAAQFFQFNGEDVKIIPSSWIEEHAEFGIYGDFIFSATYDPQYCTYWDKLFMHGIKKFPEGTLQSLIHRAIPCVMTIEKNQVRARELKRVFA